MIDYIKDKMRMSPWAIGAGVMVLVLGVYFSAQLGLMLWMVAKMAIAAFVGYWIDRTAFPLARPMNMETDQGKQASRYRRALIIAACLIAVGSSA